MKEVGHELNSEQKNLRKKLPYKFFISEKFIIFVPMIGIVQIMGMVFVGIIMVCIAWTIVEYIFTNLEGPGWSRPSKRNQKLLDRANKALKKKRQ